jgi:hypothetical protein
MKIAILETKALAYAKDIKDGIEAAGEDAVKLATFMQNNQAKIVALASLAGPEAAAVTSAGTGLLNLAITAVKGAGDAASANGVNVSLDAAAVAEVKAAITAVEKI